MKLTTEDTEGTEGLLTNLVFSRTHPPASQAFPDGFTHAGNRQKMKGLLDGVPVFFADEYVIGARAGDEHRLMGGGPFHRGAGTVSRGPRWRSWCSCGLAYAFSYGQASICAGFNSWADGF
ncbi:MAG: hypothetical protein WCC92_14355 [Candidatus Korobacteraceae bacterium]